MSLKDQLTDELKLALKAQDKVRKTTLRDALAAIKQIEIDSHHI